MPIYFKTFLRGNSLPYQHEQEGYHIGGWFVGATHGNTTQKTGLFGKSTRGSHTSRWTNTYRAVST